MLLSVSSGAKKLLKSDLNSCFPTDGTTVSRRIIFVCRKALVYRPIHPLRHRLRKPTSSSPRAIILLPWAPTISVSTFCGVASSSRAGRRRVEIVSSTLKCPSPTLGSSLKENSFPSTYSIRRTSPLALDPLPHPPLNSSLTSAVSITSIICSIPTRFEILYR